MKSKILLIKVAVFCLTACNNSSKTDNDGKKPEQNAPQKNVPEQIVVEKYTSEIRPGEKLQLKKNYTDMFEYVDYDDHYDDFLFVVKKGDSIHSLIDAGEIVNNLELNKGDLLEIQWKMDSMRPAGDESLLLFKEFAQKITKIKDGKLSVFLKNNKKPRKYIFMADDISEGDQKELTNEVEYFLAITTDKKIQQYLNDKKGLIEIQITPSYWKNETEKGSKNGFSSIIKNYVPYEYTELIRLGIEYEDENYYNKAYYQFNEELYEFIPIKF